MKNDLTSYLYTPILRDINKIIEILEYQPTCSDGFPTFTSFNRLRLIEDTLHKLVSDLRVSDILLQSFKVNKSLQDPNSCPNFAEMFGKEKI